LNMDHAADHLWVKMIPGREYDRATKTWLLPCSVDSLREVLQRFPTIFVSDIIVDSLSKAKNVLQRVAELKDLDCDLLRNDLPIKATPYSHQRRAYCIALELFA